MAKTTKKSKAQTNKAIVANPPRRLKTATKYRKGHFEKRIKHEGPKLSSGWQIFKRSIKLLKQNKKLFGGILSVYALLSILLVRGLSSTANLSTAKASAEKTGTGILSTGSSLISSLFGSANAPTTSSSTYQTVLFVIVSLVVIWALRQVYQEKNEKPSVKDAFYKSSSPLVQFILVLVVIIIKTLPLLLGTGMYALVISNGLAVTTAEILVWGSVFGLLTVWSLYMVTPSLLAMYIVTLPGMQPRQALRSAKELVRFRRWTAMRKVLFLPLILFIIFVGIMLPTVLWLTPIAEWVFFVIGLAMVIISHSYLYELYRELM